MKRDLSNLALSSSVQPILQTLPTSFQSSHISTNREAANLATLQILVHVNSRAVLHRFFRLLKWSVCFFVAFDSSVCCEKDANYYAYLI